MKITMTRPRIKRNLSASEGKVDLMGEMARVEMERGADLEDMCEERRTLEMT